MDDACACPTLASGSESKGRAVLLVVDDEPSILRAASRLLETEGYVVHLASSESEAFAHARRTDAPPHLIVMDLWMSPTPGAELARRMQAEGIASKFLFITASEGDHGPLPGPLLEKPFSADRFFGVISDLLAR
jgi:CheY-like chemotaxis protein